MFAPDTRRERATTAAAAAAATMHLSRRLEEEKARIRRGGWNGEDGHGLGCAIGGSGCESSGGCSTSISGSMRSGTCSASRERRREWDHDQALRLLFLCIAATVKRFGAQSRPRAPSLPSHTSDPFLLRLRLSNRQVPLPPPRQGDPHGLRPLGITKSCQRTPRAMRKGCIVEVSAILVHKSIRCEALWGHLPLQEHHHAALEPPPAQDPGYRSESHCLVLLGAPQGEPFFFMVVRYVALISSLEQSHQTSDRSPETFSRQIS